MTQRPQGEILFYLETTNQVTQCGSKINNKGITIAGPCSRAVCGEVCCRSPAETVGSNTAGGMDVCLFRVLCVVR